MSVELLAIRTSPWSERARWALDHSGVDYRYREFQLMLSEPAARLRLGDWRGRVTAPALLRDGGAPLRESVDIARWADGQRAPGTPSLFPDDSAADVDRIIATTDPALEAGRARATRRIADDRAARLENLPPGIPSPLRPLLAPVAAFGVRYFVRKYDMAGRSDAGDSQVLRAALTDVREALAGREYLCGDQFTFADIAAAVVLHFVDFPAVGPGRLGPANRNCWGDPELASEFADLVEWRDSLYAKHR